MDQRELARLIIEEGLSPAAAAARLGGSEAEARGWVARWYLGTAAPPPRRRRLAGRRLAGIAVVLAFIPVGAFASAALFGGDDGKGQTRSVVAGAPALAKPGVFTSTAARSKRPPHSALIARVPSRAVKVFAKPDRRAKHTLLAGRTLGGKQLPLVLLVERRRSGWLKIQLPTRPNLADGWIHARAARLHIDEWRLRVDLSRHTITTWRGTRRISVHPIGVGKSVTPTPHGRYYLTDLVKPPDPNGLYGAYAFGLSAHSNVLTTFGAGDGQIGLHGTNDPHTLGTRVSHGCIRVANRVIESFARHLPLGTPVTIAS